MPVIKKSGTMLMAGSQACRISPGTQGGPKEGKARAGFVIAE
jgi:hypothetical protein